LVVIVSWKGERGLGFTCFVTIFASGHARRVGGHCELGGREGIGDDLIGSVSDRFGIR
jgi:hypothetical protein